MIKSGFDSVPQTAPGSRTDGAKKSGTNVKPEIVFKSQRTNKSYVRPVSEQACVLMAHSRAAFFT
jgi:hypothetical protein